MNKRGIVGISGISESRSAYIISKTIEKEKGKSLIITTSEPRARKLAMDLSFFTEKSIHVIPAEDQVFLRYEAKSRDDSVERLNAVKNLLEDPTSIVISPVTAAIKPLIPHKYFKGKTVSFALGEEKDLEKLEKLLVSLGYKRMNMVESIGEFSRRGGIVDIFPPDSDNPYRVEFFDMEIDSIRVFNIENQRSIKTLSQIEIGPAEQILIEEDLFSKAAEKIREEYTNQAKKLLKKGDEYIDAVKRLESRRDELCEYIEGQVNIELLSNYMRYFYDEIEYLWDYMEAGTVYIEDPGRIMELLQARSKELKVDFDIMLQRGDIVPGDYNLITGIEDFQKIYSKERVYLISPFPKKIKGVEIYESLHNYRSSSMLNFGRHMDLLENELKSYVKKGYKIYLTTSSDERKKNLIEFCDRAGILGNVNFIMGNLSQGFDLIDERICYISDNDIFGERKLSKKKKKNRSGQELENFTDLKTGDFVVHESHGIGKFLGIKQLEVHGEFKDYLHIKYAGNDRLYVPVEQFDIVQKYIGADGSSPKINKLSGGDWKQTKARARKAISDMTEELIQLYAKREATDGYSFSKDTTWQKEFEDTFPYQETDDQLRAIEEIKTDMEKPKAMDRLLCGDVGFGKTEVAARALFKCIADGKQAAVLVPTTVLANQHFYNLKDRFQKFAINVELLSRFRSKSRQDEIIKGIYQGHVDLVIGTHRILSKDVKFKDLGLLVVDEEQRFGVKHKEALKELKNNIDVLTLSATPIPRTLNMSLTGVKDMSLITEPPEERYPIQTYVMEQDDYVIAESIKREIDRGGQAFVIYNRVKGISQLANHIKKLVPDARVSVGHGRMKEEKLEEVMIDFINHESDVLVSTTIIESGIDIPNANTLIIMDADRYGLSQLYQLRGRVGRSTRLAYAYLMYRKDKVLTEIADKRLRAIREFTEFGSGFKVAMRDLEIRGAGNLLGSQQSGHIMNIGYELYCKMVDDAVKKLRGEIVHETIEDISVEIAVSVNIPDWYIDDEILKLEMYKRISFVKTLKDQENIVDELIDRYGDVPLETLNLIKIARIRSLSEEISVRRIYEQNKNMFFSFVENSGLKPISIIKINDEFKGKAFIHGGVEPYIRIPLIYKRKLDDAIRLLEIIKETQNAV